MTRDVTTVCVSIFYSGMSTFLVLARKINTLTFHTEKKMFMDNLSVQIRFQTRLNIGAVMNR